MPELFASEYPNFTRTRMEAARDAMQVFIVRKDDKGRAVVRTMIEQAKTIDLAAPYGDLNFYDLRHILSHLRRKRGVQMRAVFYGAPDTFDQDVVAAFAKAAGKKADVRHALDNPVLTEALIVDKTHILTPSEGSLAAVFNDPETNKRLNRNFEYSWQKLSYVSPTL